MNRQDIYNKLNAIFQQELDRPDILLADNTTAADIPGWDSLMHVILVVSIENEFGISFKTHEILSWDNVGAMVDSISTKL